MLERIKFHLDENVSNAIAEGLRRRGVDVTTTPNENLIGASDEDQLASCLSRARVIFTKDDDFLKIHQFTENHLGIIYCRQGSRSIGEMVSALFLIWECLEPAEMVNTVEFI